MDTSRAAELARPVKLLLLDVDGVLTSGQITYDSSGQETKSFHILDGLGIKLLQRNGVEVGIITGRSSPMVARRARELGIELVVQGREDKCHAMLAILQEKNLMPEQVAYMGDDLPDLAAVHRAGLGIAPANAVQSVQKHADLVTRQPGGHGAVREASEFILSAKGVLDRIVSEYLNPSSP